MLVMSDACEHGLLGNFFMSIPLFSPGDGPLVVVVSSSKIGAPDIQNRAYKKTIFDDRPFVWRSVFIVCSCGQVEGEMVFEATTLTTTTYFRGQAGESVENCLCSWMHCMHTAVIDLHD